MKAVVQEKDSRRTPICQSHSAETLRGGMAIDARWDGDGQLTSLGGMAYFAEYLRTGGFLDKLLHGSPLRYSSPNAPDPADVMGALLVAVLDGLSRYAGINQLRRDMVFWGALAIQIAFSTLIIMMSFYRQKDFDQKMLYTPWFATLGFAAAFAIAFGLGGRNYAERKLEEWDREQTKGKSGQK